LLKAFFLTAITIITGGILYQSFLIPTDRYRLLHPGIYPGVIAAILLVVMIPILVSTYKELAMQLRDKGFKIELSKGGKTVLVTVIVCILYMFSLTYLGYFVSIFWLMVFLMWYYGSRTLKSLATSFSFSLGITVSIYVILNVLLNLYLPTALLF